MFQDNRFYCSEDIDFQMSTSSMKAYWTVPDNVQLYTTDAHIAIEQRSRTGGMCYVTFYNSDRTKSLKIPKG